MDQLIKEGDLVFLNGKVNNVHFEVSVLDLPDMIKQFATLEKIKIGEDNKLKIEFEMTDELWKEVLEFHGGAVNRTRRELKANVECIRTLAIKFPNLCRGYHPNRDHDEWYSISRVATIDEIVELMLNNQFEIVRSE